MSEVAFVRYDASTGAIKNSGHMHKDFVLAEQRAGHPIIIIPETLHISRLNGVRVNLDTGELESFTPPVFQDLQGLTCSIAAALAASDHYFIADSDDNITPEQRETWREYRLALRAAGKLQSFDDILAAVPVANPKGFDAFQRFR